MKDIMLISLITLAGAEKPIEQDVTLIVGGFLVSGFVMSDENYVKRHQITESIEIAFEQLRKIPVPKGEEPTDDSPNFIHLRDAKYYTPGGNPIPGNMGVFVRIPLESVHGFSFGVLETLKSKNKKPLTSRSGRRRTLPRKSRHLTLTEEVWHAENKKTTENQPVRG